MTIEKLKELKPIYMCSSIRVNKVLGVINSLVCMCIIVVGSEKFAKWLKRGENRYTSPKRDARDYSPSCFEKDSSQIHHFS